MPTFTEVFGARILIVDDQSSNVKLLEFTLRRAGYREVSSTSDPLQVAALHRQNRYDLILLDLQMPQMNGFEVMVALSEAENPASILVLSADPSQTSAALQCGASDFLGKPFDLGEVLLRVRRLLEKTMAAWVLVPLAPATAPVARVA
jgi:DNA-binding response OmpR family regulator